MSESWEKPCGPNHSYRRRRQRRVASTVRIDMRHVPVNQNADDIYDHSNISMAVMIVMMVVVVIVVVITNVINVANVSSTHPVSDDMDDEGDGCSGGDTTLSDPMVMSFWWWWCYYLWDDRSRNGIWDVVVIVRIVGLIHVYQEDVDEVVLKVRNVAVVR